MRMRLGVAPHLLVYTCEKHRFIELRYSTQQVPHGSLNDRSDFLWGEQAHAAALFTIETIVLMIQMSYHAAECTQLGMPWSRHGLNLNTRCTMLSSILQPSLEPKTADPRKLSLFKTVKA